MLPGQKYTAEDLARLLWRRKWLVVLPTVVGLVAAVVYARRLPDLYRSETVILVVPQRIPDTYVKSTVTGRIEDRLATISDQIVSRSRLERIILDLNLYPTERQTGLMEDVVARMRADIGRVQLNGKESFRVSYVSGDPRTAQLVAQRLASLFIEENLRDRENLAEDTSHFLESQLAEAKSRLVQHEKRLEDYRRRYSGQLPSQAPANLQAIQTLQLQLAANGEAADRGRDRRLVLERQIAELQAPEPLATGSMVTADGRREPAVETVAQRYEAAKAALGLLRVQKRPDHPDVRALERTIRDLEGEIKGSASRSATAAKAPLPLPLSPVDVQRQARLRDLRDQVADIDRNLADLAAQESRLRQSLAEYQGKVEAVPARESELVELTRDYATLQGTYQSLLAKREDAKMAVNLERRNIGEQFRVLDPAKVPERPFSPNRLQIRIVGTAAGLLLGLGLVAFLDYRDTTFKSEADVTRLLDLPVLAIVPTMTAPGDKAPGRWRAVLFKAAGAVLMLASTAGLLWQLAR